jgi:hypothetical protein
MYTFERLQNGYLLVIDRISKLRALYNLDGTHRHGDLYGLKVDRAVKAYLGIK